MRQILTSSRYLVGTVVVAVIIGLAGFIYLYYLSTGWAGISFGANLPAEYYWIVLVVLAVVFLAAYISRRR